MKRLLFAFGCMVVVSCSPTADKVKGDCLKDENNKIFFGSQTPAYCDCLYEKLHAIEDSVRLTDEVIDSVTTECEAEYTSLDTNF